MKRVEDAIPRAFGNSYAGSPAIDAALPRSAEDDEVVSVPHHLSFRAGMQRRAGTQIAMMLDTHDGRNAYLLQFVANYNRTRLKCLGYKAPLEALANLPGPNTQAGIQATGGAFGVRFLRRKPKHPPNLLQLVWVPTSVGMTLIVVARLPPSGHPGLVGMAEFQWSRGRLCSKAACLSADASV